MSIQELGFKVPVAVFVFNRPYQTRRVLLALKAVRPITLFIIADGPRESKPGDIELCEQVRNMVDEIVDWPCKVYKKYRQENLGCGLSPANGISWVFENVDRAIILEDDCLPSYSFFEFCQEGLERYIQTPQVMMISGNNHLLGKKAIENSYFYSINTQTHGWATWRRAWDRYDFYMRDWPKVRSFYWLWSIHRDLKYAIKWLKIFDEVYKKANTQIKYDCWDFQWTYACWKNQALNVIPHKNLVKNIGYGFDATHATPLDHPLSKLEAEEISFPLVHPVVMQQDSLADDILSKNVYGNYSFLYRVIRKLKKILKIKLHKIL